jgi:hypothetical protein
MDEREADCVWRKFKDTDNLAKRGHVCDAEMSLHDT